MTFPRGFRLRADRRTRRLDGGTTLLGGTPPRVLRLSGRGAAVAGRLLDGATVTSDPDAALARRLVDAGLAHPVPAAAAPGSVEVVVPVYDEAEALDRCLATLGTALPVTVVDDGSPDPDPVAAAAGAHGARLLRLDRNRGPGAARNAGVRSCTADVVAFVDADVVVSAEAVRSLVAHLADPAVVAAAPRIRSLRRRRGRVLSALAERWSPLDAGPEPSLVAPRQRVPFVPSTVLVVRRSALDAVGGFDEAMRYGEDVDLGWRLSAAGQQVRYDPSVVARHDEPATWQRWLTRRAAYGSSAAALAVRHGDAMAPVTLRPVPLAGIVLAVVGQPRAAVALTAITAARVQLRLRRAGAPTVTGTVGAVAAPLATAVGLGRWLTQLGWPAALAAAVVSRRARRAVAVLVAAPPLVEWIRRRPPLDPVRWTSAVVVDEVAYGVGVWRGCLRERTWRPLLPRVR